MYRSIEFNYYPMSNDEQQFAIDIDINMDINMILNLFTSTGAQFINFQEILIE